MAQFLALSGTSAQIITLPSAALQPVIQSRKVGRLPKGVINLRTIRQDIRLAAYQESLRLEEIEKISVWIGTTEHWINVARKERNDLIQAQRTAARLGISHV